MALNTAQVNVTLTAVTRQDGNHALGLVTALTGARGSMHKAKDGDFQNLLPPVAPGITDDDFAKSDMYWLYVGGWDENNALGTTPYLHQAGDIFTVSRLITIPQAGVYDGTYIQLAQVAPVVALKLSHSKLPLLQLSSQVITFISSGSGGGGTPPGGGLVDAYYEYIQNSPAVVWIINHPLNKKPSVTVTDSAGSVVIGQVAYTSNSQVIVTFNAAFSGKAELN